MKMRSISAILVVSVLALSGCITDYNLHDYPEKLYPGVRAQNCEMHALACEGLGFSRIVTCPVLIPLAGASEFMAKDHQDCVNRALGGVFGAVLEAPVLMVEEIGVGLAEMLSLQQFKSQYYPWEQYEVSMKYEQSEHMRKFKEEYRREHPNPNLEFLGEVVTGAAEGVIEGASQVAVDATTKKTTTAPGDGSSSGGGYGSISGPTNLGYGETAVYRLYVGGKKVNADWHQNGTSITVYGSGDHARAMGGNPPIKSGKFKTGIRATYNGKTYNKTIYIVK